MITTKQRALLRSLANNFEPVMQIGKEGISENSLTQLNALFEARELIKVKVLNNANQSAREFAQLIAQKTGCEIVQVIGNKMVFYKKSCKKNFKHIELV